MTVFQAYCTNSQDDNAGRLVLTFPDSSVADQWWRAISDTPSVAPSFTRVNPQFYTHNPNILNILNFSTDARTKSIAESFKGRFFMTLINDRLGREIPIIENLNAANAISGNWFFIRSTADPALFWHYDQRNYALIVSKTWRTRIRITAVQAATAGKVLIGTDTVRLEIGCTIMSQVSIDSSGCLQLGNNAHEFLFGDLKNKKIMFDDYMDKLQHVGDEAEGSGWTWELVE